MDCVTAKENQRCTEVLPFLWFFLFLFFFMEMILGKPYEIDRLCSIRHNQLAKLNVSLLVGTIYALSVFSRLENL